MKIKYKEHPIYNKSLEELKNQAIADSDTIRLGMKAWSEKVRPSDGQKGRFNWAVEIRDWG